MRPLGYLVGAGMILEGTLTLLSPRMVLELYRRWRGVLPRPASRLYEEVSSLSDHILRGVALGQIAVGILLVALARRAPD